MIRRGFTLLELMVTMAIGGLLLVLAASILGQAGRTYTRGSDGIAAEREARAALALLSDDLAQAIWHTDSKFLSSDNHGWRQDELGLLSLQAPDAQSTTGRNGDLCAVHYQLRDLTLGNQVVRCLTRGFHDSGTVFPALTEKSLPSLFAPRDQDEPLAFGVVAFEAHALVREDDGELRDWPPDPTRTRGPDFLRIRLVIARRDLLAKLTRSADWDAHRLLGNSSSAANHPQLEVHESLLRFGHHD
ncbi:MAG: prepilin-type N-terminal cleavage/methylation domain-containing protein [Verrucomicrobia bacterium]|nr:MAG: prepilin-type N-terminal cleavage/methylation domain-containing protein [Verrucomicrobiota bacterium]TAE88135.1 MAG: prepilin-type N-terminal cleavage/methylation domain-containing protein [Verrucomicrobiota bacterium]TAF26020.1 MAG: prepilin-type N-terminal cleavage/methylation domain-containing protein [Verrucomicrobiota bacterium]